MRPEQTIIAIQRKDGILAIRYFVTREFSGPPLTDEQKQTVIEGQKAVWDSNNETYTKQDIQDLQSYLDTYHIEREVKPTTENIEADMAKSDYLTDNVESWAIVESIPENKAFRDAWKLEKGEVVHDLDKCKEIYLNYARALRADEFVQLDKEYIIAQQQKQDTTDIETKAQYLRDLPETLSEQLKDATTPEEILAIEIKMNPS